MMGSLAEAIFFNRLRAISAKTALHAAGERRGVSQHQRWRDALT
jgi:hypothetical protein